MGCFPKYKGKVYPSLDALKKELSLESKSKSSEVERKGTMNVYWSQSESETSTKILSNLAPRKFKYESIDGVEREYGSVEHAYQTNKNGKFDKAVYERGKKDYVGAKKGFVKLTERGKRGNLQIMKDLVVESFMQNPNSEAAKMLMKYENFTHNTNQLIDQAFLEGLKLAQRELESTQTTQGDEVELSYENRDVLNKMQALYPSIKIGFTQDGKSFEVGDGKVVMNQEEVNLTLNDKPSIDKFIDNNPSIEIDIEKRLTDFLSGLNVDVSLVSNLKDRLKEEGLPSDAVAVADVIHKSLSLSSGEYTTRDFAEKTAIFALEFMGTTAHPEASSEVNKALSELDTWDQYDKFYSEYSNNPLYRNANGTLNEKKVKVAILSKAIADGILKRSKSLSAPVSSGKESKLEGIINTILAMFDKIWKSSYYKSFDRFLKKNGIETKGKSKVTFKPFNAIINSVVDDILFNRNNKILNDKSRARKGDVLLNFNELLSSNKEVADIYNNLNLAGFMLTGSPAMSMEGSVFRESNESLHDLDWKVPKDMEDTWLNTVKELYPEIRYKINAKSNKEQIFEKGGSVTHTLMIGDLPIDFFIEKAANFKENEFGNARWQDSMDAKLDIGRNKDLRDLIDFKTSNNELFKNEKYVHNQKAKDGSIKGQANIDAMTVLFDADKISSDTIYHEYAHHYIAWNRNTSTVQEAIKKWGSEEALVQAIGEQSVIQKGEAIGWFKKFIKWLKGDINKLSKLDKEKLKNVLTDSFLTNEDLGEGNFNNDKVNPNRKVGSNKGKKTITQVISGWLNAFVDNAKDPYISLVNNNTKTANVVFLMLRAGVNPDYVNAFVSQPAIKKYVETQFYMDSKSYVPTYVTHLTTVIKDGVISIKEDKMGTPLNIAYKAGTEGRLFTKELQDLSKVDLEELESNILEGNSDNQVALLNKFIEIYHEADKLNDAVKSTKADTEGTFGNNASQFAHTELVRKVEENDYVNNYSKIYEGFLGNMDKNSQKGANALSSLFLSTSDFAKEAAIRISEMTGIGPYAVNKDLNSKVFKALRTYVYAEHPMLQVSKKEKSRILDTIPEKLMRLKEDFPSNVLFKALNVTKVEGKLRIGAGSKTMEVSEIDGIWGTWEDLLNGDKKKREFANDLIKYSFITSGFTSGLSSFHDYVPTSYMKKQGFYKLLDDKLEEFQMGMTNDDFIIKFLIHSATDSKVVPKVSKKHVKAGFIAELGTYKGDKYAKAINISTAPPKLTYTTKDIYGKDVTNMKKVFLFSTKSNNEKLEIVYKLKEFDGDRAIYVPTETLSTYNKGYRSNSYSQTDIAVNSSFSEIGKDLGDLVVDDVNKILKYDNLDVDFKLTKNSNEFDYSLDMMINKDQETYKKHIDNFDGTFENVIIESDKLIKRMGYDKIVSTINNCH